LSGITDQDSTSIVLSQPYAVILFCEDFSTPFAEWKDDFAKLHAAAKARNIPVYAVTNRMDEAIKNFAGTSFVDVPLFKCDYTAIRTAARTNPTVYFLKEGIVLDKQSYRRMAKILDRVEGISISNRPPEAGK
jgi:sigma54-dependent transcription regulator